MTDSFPVTASVEVKVGEETSDRIARGLSDIFSPIQHTLGLLGDNVRAWRDENALRKFARIRALAEDLNLTPKPPAGKFIAAFVEKASADDETANDDLWARLFLEAGNRPNTGEFVFLDLMSKLTRADIAVLDFFRDRFKQSKDGRSYFAISAFHNASYLEHLIRKDQTVDYLKEPKYADRLEIFRRVDEKFGGHPILISVLKIGDPSLTDGSVRYFSSPSSKQHLDAAEILAELNILEAREYFLRSQDGLFAVVGYQLTRLGIRFLTSVGKIEL